MRRVFAAHYPVRGPTFVVVPRSWGTRVLTFHEYVVKCREYSVAQEPLAAIPLKIAWPKFEPAILEALFDGMAQDLASNPVCAADEEDPPRCCRRALV